VEKKKNENEKRTIREMMQATEEAHRKKEKELKRLKRGCVRQIIGICEVSALLTCFCREN